MTIRVIADQVPAQGGRPARTRYTLALYGGIVTELSGESLTNALFAYNLDMATPPAEPGGEPRLFPAYAEEVPGPGGKPLRRPAPLWLAHGNVQDGIDQSQQAVRGGV